MNIAITEQIEVHTLLLIIHVYMELCPLAARYHQNFTT
jgi:hypothetical protein